MKKHHAEGIRITSGANSGEAEERETSLSLYERHAEAQRDLVETGEAFRRAVMRHGSGTSDLAYAAWQQAKARTTAIYAEIKAHRERLVAQGIAEVSTRL